MPRPPNILLVITDQQCADTIAALGNPALRTPTLDRLARSGTAFDRAYTPSPVCVAARCALTTGRPPHETGCVDNGAMPADANTLPARLGRLGYATHGVGKMHFCPRPWDGWGFDSRDASEELDYADGGDDYRRFLADNGFGHVREPHGLRGEWYYTPQPSQVPERLHHTRWVADRAIDFLERRDRRRPFFLQASFVKPHPPFESPPPWDRLYRGPDMATPLRHPRERSVWTYWNRVQNRYKFADAGDDRRLHQLRRAAYYGAISFIDREVGRMLDALGPEIDETLIVFTSDHGEFLGDYGCVGKRSMLDAAARVPLLARWPGHLPAGRRCGSAVSLLDLMPTFLAAAGADDPVVHPDGGDLLPIARGHDRDRVVTGQYQRGRYALYLAADRDGKFVRSAADRRSWHFAGDSLCDTPEVARIAEGGEHLEDTLFARFARDGYGAASEGGRWIDYEPPTFPEHDPDAGLLYQDPPGVGDDLPPGYGTRRDDRLGRGETMATPDPFRRPDPPRPTLEYVNRRSSAYART